MDLVGLQGQNLADGGDFSQGSSGGQLTAGNTRIVGTLGVAGNVQFAQSLGISGNITVGGSIGTSTAATITSQYALIDKSTNRFAGTAIALNASGLPRMAYYDQGDVDLYYAECSDKACSSPATTLVASTGDIGQDREITILGDGSPAIAYNNDTANTLMYAHYVGSGGTGCATAAWTCTTLDAVSGAGDGISMVTAADGFARISYANDSLDDLKYIVCNNAACSSPTTSTIDNSNAGGTGMSLDSSGNPMIAYENTSSATIDFAHYVGSGGTGCSIGATWNCVNVSTGGSGPGSYISMVTGPDGFARIAHYGFTGDVMFTRCTNANCSASNTQVLGPTDDEGIDLAIGADGYARIVYYETANTGDLTLGICGNDNCSSFRSVKLADTFDYFSYTGVEADSLGNLYISYQDGANMSINYMLIDQNGDAPVLAGNDIGSAGSAFARGYINNLHTANYFQQSTADNQRYFVVQNAAGNDLFSIDSSNSTVKMLDVQGEIAGWQHNWANMPTCATDGGGVAVKGYLYWLGGNSCGTSTDIWYAKINADGSVVEAPASGFTTSSVSMPADLDGFSTVVNNDYIYIIGGNNSGDSAVSSAYYTRVNSDGSLNAWQTAASLPAAREYGVATVAKGYIYYIGGETGGTAQSTVYYARINTDGSLGSWSTNSYDLGCATPGCGSPVVRSFAWVGNSGRFI